MESAGGNGSRDVCTELVGRRHPHCYPDDARATAAIRTSLPAHGNQPVVDVLVLYTNKAKLDSTTLAGAERSSAQMETDIAASYQGANEALTASGVNFQVRLVNIREVLTLHHFAAVATSRRQSMRDMSGSWWESLSRWTHWSIVAARTTYTLTSIRTNVCFYVLAPRRGSREHSYPYGSTLRGYI